MTNHRDVVGSGGTTRHIAEGLARTAPATERCEDPGGAVGDRRNPHPALRARPRRSHVGDRRRDAAGNVAERVWTSAMLSLGDPALWLPSLAFSVIDALATPDLSADRCAVLLPRVISRETYGIDYAALDDARDERIDAAVARVRAPEPAA